MMKYIRLVTGELIPAVGLGTAGLFEDKCEQAIQWALEMGYRLIDTAWAYRNQEAIGKAIWESGFLVRKSSLLPKSGGTI